MLEFLARTVFVLLDILNNRLPPISCILIMKDITTSEGWLSKYNFKEEDEDETQMSCKKDLTR